MPPKACTGMNAWAVRQLAIVTGAMTRSIATIVAPTRRSVWPDQRTAADPEKQRQEERIARPVCRRHRPRRLAVRERSRPLQILERIKVRRTRDRQAANPPGHEQPHQQGQRKDRQRRTVETRHCRWRRRGALDLFPSPSQANPHYYW
jgi:hypothetical protein